MANQKVTKPYIQFSKLVVIFVTLAVTALCTSAVVLTYKLMDVAQMVNAVRAYIEYATIAFVSYSGNSAVEKWLVNRRNTNTEEIHNENEVGSHG